MFAGSACRPPPRWHAVVRIAIGRVSFAATHLHSPGPLSCRSPTFSVDRLPPPPRPHPPLPLHSSSSSSLSRPRPRVRLASICAAKRPADRSWLAEVVSAFVLVARDGPCGNRYSPARALGTVRRALARPRCPLLSLSTSLSVLPVLLRLVWCEQLRAPLGASLNGAFVCSDKRLSSFRTVTVPFLGRVL